MLQVLAKQIKAESRRRDETGWWVWYGMDDDDGPTCRKLGME